jgi:plastocyanin
VKHPVVLTVGTLIAALAAASPSRGQTAPPKPQPAPPPESAAVEELRKELRQMRAQMQSVKSSVAEAVELHRLSTEALERALRIFGESGAVTTAPETTPRAGLSKSDQLRPSPPPASPRRRVAIVEPTSTVRGKVEVPPTEPAAFVFVENVRGPVVSTKVVIQQVRKQFVPNWAVVQRGTMVEFPNLDPIFHNVFSLSAGNSFDLGLYSSAKTGQGHRFMEAGGVDVYCNIHPQMSVGILVVPSKHFTQVKPDGSFELSGVPAGKRKVVAWAPGSRLAGTWVEAPENESVAVNLRLERKAPRHKRKDGRPYGSYE